MVFFIRSSENNPSSRINHKIDLSGGKFQQAGVFFSVRRLFLLGAEVDERDRPAGHLGHGTVPFLDGLVLDQVVAERSFEQMISLRLSASLDELSLGITFGLGDGSLSERLLF